jgi:hypothetical protein
MRIKHRGKVGIDMKRAIRSTLTVSRRPLSVTVSANNAVRFTFAQLFFGIFGFWFTPMPI